MNSIAYIVGRINLSWLNAHWLIVASTIIYDLYLFSQPLTARAVILAALLVYFVVGTWPYRWLLDIIIVLIAISFIGDGIHQAQLVIRGIAHV
jgi:hypothetical protein